MTLNAREWNLLLATIVVVLLGSTWMMGEGKLLEWRELSESREDLEFQRTRSLERIGRKEDLLRRMEIVKLVLPQHAVGQDLKSDFLQRIQNLAEKSALNVRGMDPEKEKTVATGGLHKMAINASWQGTLKELIPFLYDLQSQGVVMDVRQLVVKADNSGLLKGNLIVDFAYSRGAPAGATELAAGEPSLPPPAVTNAAPSVPSAVPVPAPSPSLAARTNGTVTATVRPAPVALPALPASGGNPTSPAAVPAFVPTDRKPTVAPLPGMDQGVVAVAWNGIPVELLLREYSRLTGRTIEANGLDADRTVTFSTPRGALVNQSQHLAYIEIELEKQGLRLQPGPGQTLSLTK